MQRTKNVNENIFLKKTPFLIIACGIVACVAGDGGIKISGKAG
jgi:hypothetical protein